MRAIVTGGAGFIGSNLAEALIERGDTVHVIDDLSNGTLSNVPAGAELHIADILNCDKIFDLVQPEAVFHLAAQADIRKSIRNPFRDASVNVGGTLRILEAARRHDAKVVFASTGGAIYGECDTPATEQSPRLPLSPYGAAKLSAENYLHAWNRLYATEHVALRLANVYGPRQDPRGEAGVVAIFMGVLREYRVATIYGDGLQVRDYIHVGDVVAAMLAAHEHSPSPVYNIGTGAATSVNYLYGLIRQITGVNRNPVFKDARLGELRRGVLDPSLARDELGWTPSRSLEVGLAETWQRILLSPDYHQVTQL